MVYLVVKVTFLYSAELIACRLPLRHNLCCMEKVSRATPTYTLSDFDFSAALPVTELL